MTKEEKLAIIDVLGSEDKQRYYVYALVDSENNEVFYIGKGQKDRVWQHEESADAEKKKILEDLTLSEEEKNRQLEDISAKHARIDRIGKQNVNKVIIKWGLTEEEAFAAESALINLYRFQGIDLTNIQNGHASKKEKATRNATTEALKVEDFYILNAKECIMISELNPEHFKHNIIFVNIANEYQKNLTSQELMNIASGRWGIGRERFDALRDNYLFAMHDSVVRAVYKIREIHSGTDTTDFPKNVGVHPSNIKRQREEDLLIKLRNYSDDNLDVVLENLKLEDLPAELQDQFNELGIDNRFENWYKRVYFKCEEITDYNDYIGSRIMKIDKNGIKRSLFYKSQNPFTYNFD